MDWKLGLITGGGIASAIEFLRLMYGAWRDKKRQPAEDERQRLESEEIGGRIAAALRKQQADDLDELHEMFDEQKIRNDQRVVQLRKDLDEAREETRQAREAATAVQAELRVAQDAYSRQVSELRLEMQSGEERHEHFRRLVWQLISDNQITIPQWWDDYRPRRKHHPKTD